MKTLLEKWDWLDKNVEGWLSDISFCSLSNLLDYQKQENICGNILEIGVFKGKSACVLYDNLKKDYSEKLMLCDPYMEKEIVINNFEKYQNIKGHNETINIEDLVKFSLIYSNNLFKQINTNLYNTFRFIHIDGGHFGYTVYSDIKLVDKLLDEKGILVIDDFFSTTYPQITESVYNYLFIYPYSFKIFFIDGFKAYLCRIPYYIDYYNRCLDTLSNSLEDLQIINKILIKSSPITDTTTLGITPRNFDNYKVCIGSDFNSHYIETITHKDTF